jgi:hypothetical protein
VLERRGKLELLAGREKPEEEKSDLHSIDARKTRRAMMESSKSSPSG